MTSAAHTWTIIASLLLTSISQAQCPPLWLTDPTPAFNSEVRELIEWNGGVVARGTFTQVAGSPARGLGIWNGSTWAPIAPLPTSIPGKVLSFNNQLIADSNILLDNTWQPLGAGLNSTVYALTAFQNQLVAGGPFTASGNTPIAHVARWNGTAWSQIGQGLNGPVNDLIEFRGQLFACGTFTSPTPGATDYIARWNGSAWTGLTNVPIASTPWRMAVINDTLYLAGYGGLTGYLASFDGNTWTPEFSTFNLEPTGIVVYGDAIIVGAANTLLSKRNGVWTQSPQYISSSGFPKVIDLVTHEGELFIGGSFSTAAGAPAANFVRYYTPSADFNQDGDTGTDQDIEAFFACLAGTCCPTCPADFNADGDIGNDADIEAFFRVLAGGCS